MVAGIVTLAVIVISVQFVYKTCSREEMPAVEIKTEKIDEDDDEHPLLQGA